MRTMSEAVTSFAFEERAVEGIGAKVSGDKRVDEARRGVVVAIDGPAGAGKSTLARELARRLGVPYVSTGLMYRALAHRAMELGVDPDDGDRLGELAGDLRFDLGQAPGGPEAGELLVDGAPPSIALGSEEVEQVVSRVARHPQVRKVLRTRQRALGEPGCAMEGRDIGTVVFPDADVKIFLSAVPGVRADRREQERGRSPSVREAVAERDALDARTNPLTPAADAHVLDTTALGPQEVLEAAVQIVEQKVGRPGSAGARSIGRRGPVVAVVGRPNVGKSTLVNRLVGRRAAIADEVSGVTRDRLELPVRWGGRSFLVVDTGGITNRPAGIEAKVAGQAAQAFRASDVVLFVVDATAGILEEDEALVRQLRGVSVPVLVVANKVDSDSVEPLAAEFNALGMGEPIPVSAQHGRGIGELLDRIVDLLPPGDLPLLEGEPRFCIVGRPNVGKSSLFNRLVSEERAVVHEEPGTTRDALDSVIRVGDRDLRFIDTAGFRRTGRTTGVEYYGLVRSLQAIDWAHVALLVVDAREGLTGEDKRVAARVVEAGRGLVAALNKWDLVPSGERSERFLALKGDLQLFPGTPVLRTSALTGMGVSRLLPHLLAVHDSWSRRAPTAEVNRVVQKAVAAHPAPRGAGRILYATQVSSGPPTFVLFGAGDPGPSYRRYLEGTLRRAFGFDGVPVRLSFRGRDRGTRGRRSRSR
jgi:GTP-binding protein